MIDWQAHILKMDGLIVKNEVQGFIQAQKQAVVLNVLVVVFETQMDELHDHYVLQELQCVSDITIMCHWFMKTRHLSRPRFIF